MYLDEIDVATAYLKSNLEETVHKEPSDQLEMLLKVLIEGRRHPEEVQVNARQLQKRQKGASIQEVCIRVSSASDLCLFKIFKGEDIVTVAVYVDAILIESRHRNAIADVKSKLLKHYDVKDLGQVEQ